MKNNRTIESSLNQLMSWVESEKFIGYDPYDTLNSWVPFHWFGKYGQFVAIQIQKRNPVNIRPLLGIKKEIIPKSFALFLQGYSFLYKMDPQESYRKKMEYFFNWFLENRLEGYQGYCWTKNFALTFSDFARPKVDPSSVLAAFVGEAVFEYYNATNNKQAVNVLTGICDFILNHVPIYEKDDECCFSYTTLRQDNIHNANMHVAELFAKTYSITKNEKLKDLALKSTNFTIRRQKSTGEWSYRLLPDGSEKMQIDFHQGFILNSLHAVIKYVKQSDEYIESLNKGADFYFKEQFLPDGRSKFRYPKRYPIDIHHLTQGVITFSLLGSINDDYLPFAETIARWTIKNMQSTKGYFYYRKHPLFTNKISYMRWNQAWTFLAFSQLLLIKLNKKQ